jgi:hypothetical protein
MHPLCRLNIDIQSFHQRATIAIVSLGEEIRRRLACRYTVCRRLFTSNVLLGPF